jgi:hypothetical protein
VALRTLPSCVRELTFVVLSPPLSTTSETKESIGYGFVIPNSSIAGFNALTVGFSTTILGACAAYVTGVWTVVGDRPST